MKALASCRIVFHVALVTNYAVRLAAGRLVRPRDHHINLSLTKETTGTMRLSQAIAIDKSVKNQANTNITAAYHDIQKSALFVGIARTYEPKDEAGDKLPPERQHVQKRAEELLTFTASEMTRYWDMTLTKDKANTHASADVVVDGHIIFKAAPVTFLLFLEKQLIDLASMVKKLPTLDTGDVWKFDESKDCYVTEVSSAVRTKKLPKAFVRAAATKEHPAQVDVFTEDEVVGTWNTIKMSGALPAARITEVLGRITQLQSAVKMAREEANTCVADQQYVGKVVFDFLLA